MAQNIKQTQINYLGSAPVSYIFILTFEEKYFDKALELYKNNEEKLKDELQYFVPKVYYNRSAWKLQINSVDCIRNEFECEIIRI